MKKMMSILLSLVLVLGMLPTAWGAEATVTVTNSDELNSAIKTAKAGTVIMLEDAEYELGVNDAFTNSVADVGITLKGVGDNAYIKTLLVSDQLTDITFENLKLNFFDVTAAKAYEDVAFVDCTFISNNNETAISIINKTAMTVNGLRIEGCTFDGYTGTAVLFQNKAGNNNVSIKNNTFTNIGYNAIQFGNNSATGNIEISGNTITGTGSRAIRISSKAGAALTVKDNVISKANQTADELTANTTADGKMEVIKASGDGAVTFTGNTYNGEAVVVDGGLAYAPRIITVTNSDELNSAIKTAKAGTVIMLEDAEYELGVNDAFTNSVADVGITLKGVGDNAYIKTLLVSDQLTDITFENLKLNFFDVTAAKPYKNIKFIDCTFTSNDNATAISIINKTAMTVDGLAIEGCTFNGYTSSAVLFQNKVGNNNVSIKNNTFTNIGYNAIQFGNNSATGNIEISGNTIDGTGSRAIRISSKAGAALTVKDNIISNANQTADELTANTTPDGKIEIIKVSGDAVATMIFTGNTYDGAAAVVDGGVAYAPVVHKHVLTTVPAKENTCTEAGHNAYEYCTECDYISIKVEIPAAGHKMTKTAAKAATCTADGNVEYYTCSVCKKTFADEDGKTELAADKLVVKSEGHKMTKTAAKAATCTADGNIEYYTCSVCGKFFADEKGEKEVKAADLVVKSAGHDVKEIAANAPTYTADGNKEFYYCETCKTAFADAEGKTALTESQIKDLVIPQLIKVDDAKAEVSVGAMDVAIKEAAKDEEVTLDLTHKDVVGEENMDAVTEAELPVAALEAVAEEEKALTLVKEDATVTLDTKALEAVAEQAKGETVTLKVESIKVEALEEKQQAAVKDKAVALTISAELICNKTGENIATKDGKGFGEGAVTVAVTVPAKLPEGVKAADLKVYFVADDGTVELVQSELKDGKIVFSLKHFSEYVVAAEKPASPATGDSMNIALYGVLAIMSVLGMAVVLKKKAF